ncbi:DNA replication endonuclease-helicase Dna2 [Coniosporium tulheliwenetii]|uniref:DNA replication endonuclease-helicase Dna2 n=1 Tax=Coniosporium tulheliwenetii TaxID=3383036 RepID=A0ACC2ZKH6_9PEZI|nr:DNA replication endonuclease-helicase Dna2 [Cladosporium sp. JES 115]
MVTPPIKASSQSRSKLKAFQFVEGRPSSKLGLEGEDKENESVPAPNGVDSACLDSAIRLQGKVSAPVQSKTAPPSTPAPRLPLADLIGNLDNASRRNITAVRSPDETLSWNHVRSPRSSQRTVGGARSQRRRSRSSSPASSPTEEASNFFPGDKDALDLQRLSHALKTPQADPAAELWSRYAVQNTTDTPTAKKATQFAHLIGNSSPHSASEVGSVGGLRRWVSCGVEWPTPNSKRRRTTGGFREHAGSVIQVGHSSANAVPTEAKASKLCLLTRNLNTEQTAPVASPFQKLSPIQERTDEPTAKSSQPEAGNQSESDHEKRSDKSSSEFGDADIDTDMLEAIDVASGTVAPAHQVVEQPFPDVSFEAEAPKDEQVMPPLAVVIAVAQQAQQQPQAISPTDDDEFDEFDDGDDVFAADLEKLTSLYDERRTTEQQTEKERELAPFDIPSAIAIAQDPGGVLSDDEFGGDDIDVEHLAAAEAVATQVFKAGECTQSPVLLVDDEKSKCTKAITLREAWFDTPCAKGSHVHVIGEFSATGQCHITNASNMLILHPDHLISATVVADSFSCMRRAVLQDRIKATSAASIPSLYGTMLHQLFQQALSANRWDTDFLYQLIDELIPKHYETLAELNLEVAGVTEDMRSRLPEMQSWAGIFMKARPGPDAVVKDRNNKQVLMSVNKLLDVEEHVWSPAHGLKGNIDATVQVHMHDEQGDRTLTVPFEIKSGKDNGATAHRAQTALYTLLLSDRYDIEAAYGILYYMESSEISRIPALRHELVHMVMQRNLLACYVRERLELPPMLSDSFLCKNCYAKDPCLLYHKLAEDGTGSELRSKDYFDQLVKHLKPKDQDFFKKWDMLLTKEESEMMKFRRELWSMLSSEREKLGRCFANVIIEPGSASEHPEEGKIHRFRYTLVKQNAAPGFSFNESQITVGEPIVISDEKGHFALANGFVTNVRKRCIAVTVDKRLNNARARRQGFHLENNQTFTGIMDVSEQGQVNRVSQSQDDEQPILYRLDKDEFSNGMAMVRNNLIQIMDDKVFKARELRQLIIDGIAPTFNPSPTAYKLPTQLSQMAINSDQNAAIEKVMSAQQCALVLGMPGTGKTTTIAHIIRALVAKGKSVLLTSYTHTAVDNILLKIRNDNIGILRLGAVVRVHPEVQEFAELAAKPKKSLDELKDSWEKSPVVATTCLGISHSIFSRRIFDYCIVDEASQITLPVCLGPIRMARKFILLLSERHPEAVVNLEHQYRMCAEIMHLSNTLIYSGRLKCGNEAVAQRSLTISNPDAIRQHHYTTSSPKSPSVSSIPSSVCPGPIAPTCYLSSVLSPTNKVLFLNTDALPGSTESLSGTRMINALEATLTTHLVATFLSSGVPAHDIGVITFYRSQLALLRQSLCHISSPHRDTAAMEMHTADKFQGRDKEVVLVSCVRSNAALQVGELLKDWRRVNVAVTRARSKLVILGSAKTLAGNELLGDLVKICKAKGWLYDLPTNAVEGHIFEEMGVGTQVTPLGKGREAVAERMPVGKTLEMEPSPTRAPALGMAKRGGKALSSLKGAQVNARINPLRKPFKVPEKVGRVGKKGIVGSRPVLRDIVNDALADVFSQ